jgi:hypothetical protein
MTTRPAGRSLKLTGGFLARWKMVAELIGASSFPYIALVDLTHYLHRRFGLAGTLCNLP